MFLAFRYALESRQPRIFALISYSASRKSYSSSARPRTKLPEGSTVFSGIQPSGVPHVGNYLGALRQWNRLQESAAPSDQLFFCVVDLHAITVKQDPACLRRWKRETLAALLASGLNPERCVLFHQSTVPQHAELMWILGCMASIGHLSRMTQWKSKTAVRSDALSSDNLAMTSKLRLGLLAYPVLQAADILLYGATHVPVGEDQVQHLELARDYVDAFNSRHGDILVKPTALLTPGKRIMSLNQPNLKMSKSHLDPRSRIQLDDSPEDVALKVKLALTDSRAGISYDPVTRPGISNLLDIVSQFDEQERSPAALACAFHALDMRSFKTEVTLAIIQALAEIRKRYLRLIRDDDDHYIEDVAQQGSRKAGERAAATMTIVRPAVGL